MVLNDKWWVLLDIGVKQFETIPKDRCVHLESDFLRRGVQTSRICLVCKVERTEGPDFPTVEYFESQMQTQLNTSDEWRCSADSCMTTEGIDPRCD